MSLLCHGVCIQQPYDFRGTRGNGSGCQLSAMVWLLPSTSEKRRFIDWRPVNKCMTAQVLRRKYAFSICD